mmetsp:Transcript_40291/g.78407  ORF Transcript_40291/g.78407 Transcript_40291/m.78407 type:complete len:248 (+) Transcript_40291:16-759(+)
MSARRLAGTLLRGSMRTVRYPISPCFALRRIEPLIPVPKRFFGKKKKGGKAAKEHKSDSSAEAGGGADVDLDIHSEEMDMLIEDLQNDLRKFRAGRASPEMIEDLSVRAYGASTPLKSVGQIAVRDAYNLTVTVHDPSLLEQIDADLRNSNALNAATKVEGNRVVVTFPKSTKESRENLVKQVKKECEQIKTKVRKVRQNALDEIKSAKLTKDEQFQMKDDVQKITDDAVKSIDKILDSKSKDIMSM